MSSNKECPFPGADWFSGISMLNFKNSPSKKTNAQQQDPASEDVPPWAAESMLGEFKSWLVNLPP